MNRRNSPTQRGELHATRAFSRVPIASRVFVPLWAMLYALAPQAMADENRGWQHYGNDLANTRFQDVDQINRSNAANMRVAWVFHTGVLDPNAELEVSPI
jgi:glucose dehydrogenase